ncbi:MAG TPA: lipoyl synthase [bacterium]|nr:lipoyl synthase [bacterium]HOL47184.1 lipoyl synthase [bacterium]HPQ17676.1 lipoyl synthase [bacterium]
MVKLKKKKKLPEWIHSLVDFNDQNYLYIKKIFSILGIETICSAGLCPNRYFCWSKKEFSFLICGRECTRNCFYCNIKKRNKLKNIDFNEAERLAFVINKFNLDYVVLTSVSNDDLTDGGFKHFINCIKKIKMYNKTKIEVLIPDFKNKNIEINELIDSGVDVIGHNIELPKRLFQKLRPAADYDYSLQFLSTIRKNRKRQLIKSGIIIGLGETKTEVKETIEDIAETGCEVLTIGQYLSPTQKHYPVIDFIHPDIFEEYRQYALKYGFKAVLSAPLVRSSFNSKGVYFNIYGN